MDLRERRGKKRPGAAPLGSDEAEPAPPSRGPRPSSTDAPPPPQGTGSAGASPSRGALEWARPLDGSDTEGSPSSRGALEWARPLDGLGTEGSPSSRGAREGARPLDGLDTEGSPSSRGAREGERSWEAPRHPWEVVRADFFVELVRREAAGRRVLDVGAGDGYFAKRLFDEARPALLVAVDPHYTDDDLETLPRTQSGPHYVRAIPGDSTREEAPPSPREEAPPSPREEAPPSPREEAPPSPREARARAAIRHYDVILALDVAEHVDDDASFVRDLAEHLAPGGLLVLSVPAIPALYGPHDVALGHHRRYTRRALKTLVQSPPLRIEREGGLFSTLALARAGSVALGRLRARVSPQVQSLEPELRWDAPPWVTRLATRAIRADLRLSERMTWLPGLSVFVVARRA